MALPIRSIAAPLLSALLAIAGTSGAGIPDAARANEPPHPANHQNANAGSRPAPNNQPRAQMPAGPAPAYGGHGGAPAPGGQAWNHPAQIDGARGAPAWHPAPANGARTQGSANYGYAGNTRPNSGRANYAQTETVRPNYGQQNLRASGEQYRGNRYDGRRWNNGWRNDRRYDWAGWRSAHGELFHGSYYYPPYDGYGYARLGIGAALDAAFLDEQYWIEDPAYYHLPPAYGPYRWVRYYNDCLLIDIDTGQVVDVLYNVFW